MAGGSFYEKLLGMPLTSSIPNLLQIAKVENKTFIDCDAMGNTSQYSVLHLLHHKGWDGITQRLKNFDAFLYLCCRGECK